MRNTVIQDSLQKKIVASFKALGADYSKFENADFSEIEIEKHRKKIIIGIIGLLLLIYVGVNGYLVNYAFVRDSARLGAPAPKKAELLKKDQAWLAQTKQQTWTEKVS